MAEWTNGAIPSTDIDRWFAGDNEFILPADFERRWFAEDDSAVELTPAVHDVPENVAGVSLGTKRRRCGRFAKVNSLLKAAKGVIPPRKIYSPLRKSYACLYQRMFFLRTFLHRKLLPLTFTFASTNYV